MQFDLEIAALLQNVIIYNKNARAFIYQSIPKCPTKRIVANNQKASCQFVLMTGISSYNGF
jgi:hypothetical protein